MTLATIIHKFRYSMQSGKTFIFPGVHKCLTFISWLSKPLIFFCPSNLSLLGNNSFLGGGEERNFTLKFHLYIVLDAFIFSPFLHIFFFFWQLCSASLGASLDLPQNTVFLTFPRYKDSNAFHFPSHSSTSPLVNKLFFETRKANYLHHFSLERWRS